MPKKFAELSSNMKELLVAILDTIKHEQAGGKTQVGFGGLIVVGCLDPSNPEFAYLPQQIKDTILSLDNAEGVQFTRLRDILGRLLENYIAGKL